MSAQLASTNSFSAQLALAGGVAVTINAPTLADLSGVVARLQGPGAPQPANDPGNAKAAPTVAAAASTSPAPTSAPVASATPGNVPASTAIPVSAPAAASGSEAPAVTYDAVKARVLAIAKISRDAATGALAHFDVDHGNKLKPEQYAAFIAHTDKLLPGAASA